MKLISNISLLLVILLLGFSCQKDCETTVCSLTGEPWLKDYYKSTTYEAGVLLNSHIDNAYQDLTMLHFNRDSTIEYTSPTLIETLTGDWSLYNDDESIFIDLRLQGGATGFSSSFAFPPYTHIVDISESILILETSPQFYNYQNNVTGESSVLKSVKTYHFKR